MPENNVIETILETCPAERDNKCIFEAWPLTCRWMTECRATASEVLYCALVGHQTRVIRPEAMPWLVRQVVLALQSPNRTKRRENEEKKAEFIDMLINTAEVFLDTNCGYWLRRVEYDHELGTLAWEDDEQHPCGQEPNAEAAVAAWRAGEELPEGWFRLNKETAEKAWRFACARWGNEWYEDADAEYYDHILQMTLLGEIRYG